jgi:ubiquinone/menaquinone biosynthesis C-methylase UbiE
MQSTPTRGRVRRLLISFSLVCLASSAGCSSFKRCMYERGDRDAWQQPERVVASLEIKPGDRIADLGAGGGYFTFRFADAVGESGVVYAVDVDSGMTEYLEKRAKKEGYANVDVVLAEFDDPTLPDSGVDLMFTSNTYHHIEDRPAYFRNASKYLRPGGRIAIVEYEGDEGFHLFGGHSTASDEIRAEMEQAGYRLAVQHDYLSKQSFLVFEVAAD